jgi:hypothetical protein
MTERLSCPACGEIILGDLEFKEYDGVLSFGSYYCNDCAWELLDENDNPIVDADEIVKKFNQAAGVQ